METTASGAWTAEGFSCPKGWEVISPWGYGYALRQSNGGLRVVVDIARKADDRDWMHVSVSRKAWAPSHEDMALVKAVFIGEHRYAYAVYPPADRYVNIHPYCLHLWALMDEADGRVLPEFSEELPVVGKSI